MKYEDIKVGESYKIHNRNTKVVAKSDDHKAVLTIEEDEEICGWDENELELFQPIKKELPESGLLVCNNGFIAYRLEGEKGFGFNEENHFEKSGNISFETKPDFWRTANPEDEAKFIKMLKQEAEKRGLGVDAKLKGHADSARRHSANSGANTPVFILTTAWNKNGMIFHNGIWAEPLTMLDEVCDTIKKHLPNIVVEMTDGVVTLKQL